MQTSFLAFGRGRGPFLGTLLMVLHSNSAWVSCSRDKKRKRPGVDELQTGIRSDAASTHEGAFTATSVAANDSTASNDPTTGARAETTEPSRFRLLKRPRSTGITDGVRGVRSMEQSLTLAEQRKEESWQFFVQSLQDPSFPLQDPSSPSKKTRHSKKFTKSNVSFQFGCHSSNSAFESTSPLTFSNMRSHILRLHELKHLRVTVSAALTGEKLLDEQAIPGADYDIKRNRFRTGMFAEDISENSNNYSVMRRIKHYGVLAELRALVLVEAQSKAVSDPADAANDATHVADGDHALRNLGDRVGLANHDVVHRYSEIQKVVLITPKGKPIETEKQLEEYAREAYTKQLLAFRRDMHRRVEEDDFLSLVFTAVFRG